MNVRIVVGFALATFALLGCDKTGGTDTRVAELCASTTNMGTDLCRCVGDKANADLNGPSRDFLVATLENKDERVAELRQKLSLEELMKAGMFMTNAPAACAKVGMSSEPKVQP